MRYGTLSFSLRYLQPLLRSATPEATEFGEITQNEGNYAIQGHSRSPILLSIERSSTTSY